MATRYNDPDDSTEPFHEMFASSVIRHTEPWWQYYHHFSSYVGRCCSLLSQGKFVGDVAVLLPHSRRLEQDGPGAPTAIGTRRTFIKWGEIAPLIVHNGFDFNFVNDQVLVERSSLENGKLVIEKMEHSVLILPRVTSIDVPTLERVRDFCRGGGMVVAIERVPEYSTGFARYEENDAKVRSIVAEMFGTFPFMNRS